MTRILTFVVVLLFSSKTFGQDTNSDAKVSLQDSILLQEFWTNFKSAINANDKAKLTTLCLFPFYCRPCIDDTTLKNNDHVTIKVTKALFNESQYKLFFGKPIRDEVGKQNGFNIYIFHPSYNNKNRPKGFMFSYDIIAPSKTFEGMQGFIYLGKIKGHYKITGIDTVP